MPYAVLRVAKIKTQAHALAATAHNYRQRPVPNAELDEDRPNREYLNHEQKDYWSLAEARIQEAGVKRVRSDSVRAMEIILTGSPEGFVRDKEGRAADYSKSKWAQDNLHFLQKQFGKENVVSFTLHQDEKTPHIHAVVVPITEKKTLSADQLFNPQSLRQLQTEYAETMREHGMSRGVEHSQAQHQPMRRLYGQEAQVIKQVAQLSQAPALETFKLDDPPLLNREKWKQEQEARINAEIARRVQEVQERAEKLAQLAQMNTAAVEQVKFLQRTLHTSEAIKQDNYRRVHAQADQVRTAEQRLTMVAVQLAQGEKPTLDALVQQGQAVREDRKQVLVTTLERGLAKSPFEGANNLIVEVREAGFELKRGEDGKNRFWDTLTPAAFLLQEVRPNGHELKPQIDEAIKRKHAAQLLEIERAERRQRGQPDHEGRALLELSPEQLDKVKQAFSTQGAGIRPQSLENGRVQLEVIYYHTHRMVAGVSKLLDEVKELPGVKLQEDDHDRTQRQVGAARVGQNRSQPQSQERNRNRGLER